MQFATSSGDVYGIYNNLECTSITKKLEDKNVIVNLKELDSTAIRINNLEGAVADLGSAISELSEGGVK